MTKSSRPVRRWSVAVVLAQPRLQLGGGPLNYWKLYGADTLPGTRQNG